MKRLPLESNLSFQQKIHISIFIALGLFMLYRLCLLIFFFKISTVGYLIMTTIFAATAFFVVLFFSKKGLAESDGRIFNGIFLGNLLIIKRKIDLTDKTACSILKFRKSQKYSFFSAARPDLAHGFNGFDVYLLNKRHTHKTRLLSLKKEENSKRAMDFLTQNTELKNEIYSPDFS